ncbi:CPBP family intramembrane glutamic endopeptidase [Paenibacillus septentrionalis]|uniref:CPBP family intramembrane glutamic endopeptidase n=1 Tax=Paenibacillus septentrionalis TaxID=429342 RepID=A0ABW1V9E7_9BACL
MESPPLSSKILALSSLILVVLSAIILYLWQQGEMMDFLAGLFSLEKIVQDVGYGVIGSIVLLLILLGFIALRKTNLPNTKGVNDLVHLLQSSSSSLYVISIVAVIGEELFFRGVLLLLLSGFMPSWLAVVLISLVFIALHYKGQYEGQPYLLIYLFIMSLLTGFLTIEQGTLWSALIIHCVSNLASSICIRKNIIKIEQA